ncbi:unnamed protein product [Mytilus edulis]|uniref:Uncharacterized protein n=1 Tax=Mytilus edulis TaxID=6550 RepID=A0A8S3R5H7_MYTED|nr:unnamed protein product [Mytilus edulis]
MSLKWTLLLFDHDGFTTVCETKKLKKLDGSNITDVNLVSKADQVKCVFGKGVFLAEVLELADTKSVLNNFETNWLNSHRAISIQQEQDLRHASHQNVYGGYLKIWPAETDNTTEQKIASIRKGQNIRQTARTVLLDHAYTTSYPSSSYKQPDLSNFINEEVVDENNVNITSDDSWRNGRRVVELGVLADNLAACKQCGLPLSLQNCLNITTCGLAAVLKVLCVNQSCKNINAIPTGKQHNRIWDVNTKLATDMELIVSQNVVSQMTLLEVLNSGNMCTTKKCVISKFKNSWIFLAVSLMFIKNNCVEICSYPEEKNIGRLSFTETVLLYFKTGCFLLDSKNIL